MQLSGPGFTNRWNPCMCRRQSSPAPSGLLVAAACRREHVCIHMQGSHLREGQAWCLVLTAAVQGLRVCSPTSCPVQGSSSVSWLPCWHWSGTVATPHSGVARCQSACFVSCWARQQVDSGHSSTICISPAEGPQLLLKARLSLRWSAQGATAAVQHACVLPCQAPPSS